MTRREFTTVLLATVTARRTLAFEGDIRWLRCVAAVYRMIQETGTLSAVYRLESPPEPRVTPFSGVSLRRSGGQPPKTTRSDFVELASQYRLFGVVAKDREKVDRNLWSYVNTRASLSDVDHLMNQWGPEGLCLARGLKEDVEHVESCSQCRTAYEYVIRGTTLCCESEEIVCREKTKRDRTKDQGSTIPP